MSVLIKKPTALLEDYVRRYIATDISKEIRASVFPQGNFRLPNSAIRMVFHFSDKIPWLSINGQAKNQPRYHVRGYQTTPFIFNTDDNLNVFTVEFTPFGFRSIFGIPCSELELYPVAMDLVIGRDYQMLLNELSRRSTFDERVNYLNSHFTKKIGADRQVGKAGQIQRYIGESESSLSVNVLANEAFLTQRTMRRFFNEYFGMSPKQYLKLARFEKATKALLTRGQTNLFEFALDCGYYDHAHFSNDFKYFMKMTPREFQNNILKKGVVVN